MIITLMAAVCALGSGSIYFPMNCLIRTMGCLNIQLGKLLLVSSETIAFCFNLALVCSSSDDYTLQINPDSGTYNSNHMEYFKFTGRICGLAVYHKRLIDGTS